MPFPSQRRLQQGTGARQQNSGYMLQVHNVIKSECMALETTLDIQKKISAFQDPDSLVVCHIFHGLTDIEGQTDRPVTSYEKVICTSVQDGDNHSFS
jgi:hypothetical protein